MPFQRGVACTTTLHPAGGRSGPPPFSRPGQDGALAVRGVVPGAYRVGVICFGGYPQSMMSGGHDLLADPIVAVQPGVAPPALEIVAPLRRRDDSRHGARGFLPAARQYLGAARPSIPGLRWSNSVDRLPGRSGGRWIHFSADWLAPGAYMAYAFLNQDGIEYRNPQFLQSLTQGVRVQVEDGSKKTITISGVER